MFICIILLKKKLQATAIFVFFAKFCFNINNDKLIQSLFSVKKDFVKFRYTSYLYRQFSNGHWDFDPLSSSSMEFLKCFA